MIDSNEAVQSTLQMISNGNWEQMDSFDASVFFDELVLLGDEVVFPDATVPTLGDDVVFSDATVPTLGDDVVFSDATVPTLGDDVVFSDSDDTYSDVFPDATVPTLGDDVVFSDSDTYSDVFSDSDDTYSDVFSDAVVPPPSGDEVVFSDAVVPPPSGDEVVFSDSDTHSDEYNPYSHQNPMYSPAYRSYPTALSPEEGRLLTLTSLVEAAATDVSAFDDIVTVSAEAVVPEAVVLDITNADSSVVEDGNNCTICMDPIGCDIRSVIVLDCDHVFHGTCILNWMDNGRDTCPNCRSLFSLKSVEWGDNQSQF
jgi:hypothetical protein